MRRRACVCALACRRYTKAAHELSLGSSLPQFCLKLLRRARAAVEHRCTTVQYYLLVHVCVHALAFPAEYPVRT